jgi:uridine kinase
MTYTLEDYLAQASYRRSPQEFPDFTVLCEQLAPSSRPHVVGVDGPTTAGKTTFTGVLADFYVTHDVPVAILGQDSVLYDRARRAMTLDAVADGTMPISVYSEATRDQAGFRRYLRAARAILYGSDPARVTIPNAYNRFSGNNDCDLGVDISPGGVLIAEGIGVHTYCPDLLDTAIRLDVHDDPALVSRIWSRERQKPAGAPRLEDAFLEWRYENVDGPHAAHHRQASAGRADIVIDTSQFGRLIVYTKT